MLCEMVTMSSPEIGSRLYASGMRLRNDDFINYTTNSVPRGSERVTLLR